MTTCDPLPNTGLGANTGLVLVVAIACLVAGTVTVLSARRRDKAAATLALLVIAAVVALATVTTGAPAKAAPSSGCSSSGGTLSVVQTSTMVGLSPGAPGVAITGRVVNHSRDSTSIAAVEVEITSVSPGPGSAAGTCTVSDYRLTDARMAVGVTLGPGGATPFSGASIGLINRTVNQDACQDATVHLLYTANPN